jgi:ketosteroid isomerase-like protein
MTEHTPASVALAFVEAINGRNLAAMVHLMTDDHVFTDSLGAQMRGKQEMRAAWIGYAVMIPDYHITVEHIFTSGSIVALLGRASGTFSTDGKLLPKNRWEIPAAWRLLIDGGRVAEWQVYADNEPVRSIMTADERG